MHIGDCRAVLATLPDASVDSVVTDPPYELGFMGRAWDSSGIAYDVQMWRECLRVLRPGGHLLAFGGTRTHHRLACAIEDAGFEIRDSITWLYGSGFPKSLDVSKAIDRAAGATREVVGTHSRHGGGSASSGSMSGDLGTASELPLTAPATADAARWQGWGTALKPASEPIVVARKPLAGTVAANVLAHGTGALDIDGCRVAGRKPDTTRGASVNATSTNSPIGGQGRIVDDGRGRWPANVVLSHAPDCGEGDGTPCVAGCPVAELDAQSGDRPAGNVPARTGPRDIFGASDSLVGYRAPGGPRSMGDAGGASRFFPTFRYQAKAPTRERPKANGVSHPTVKPLALVRWLVRLVTPPGGTVLDPFAGSGTTAEACIAEGFRCLAVEREPTYLPLILARLERHER